MPHSDQADELLAEDFRHLSLCLIDALESAVLAQSLEPRCESPIEVELGAKINRALNAIGDKTLSLGTQYVLGPFRYDLAILRDGRADPLVLIECDGKEFHSTPEQLRNDGWKTRLAASRGILLRRFTGAKINHEPDLCVAEILQFMRYAGYLTAEQCNRLDEARIRRHRPLPVFESY